MNNTIHFDKNSPAIIHLTSIDAKLAELIGRIGEYTLTLRTDYTSSIIRAIIGQQLSVKVARTIWCRLLDLCSIVTPQILLSASNDDLRKVGLSRAKIVYIQDFSMKVLSGEISFDEICCQDDELVIRTLSKVKGIGQWTAEMFLIFSLGRRDVLAVNDAGLCRAVKWLYELDNLPSVSEMTELGKKWKPYRSVSSLYLWEAINKSLIK